MEKTRRYLYMAIVRRIEYCVSREYIEEQIRMEL